MLPLKLYDNGYEIEMKEAGNITDYGVTELAGAKIYRYDSRNMLIHHQIRNLGAFQIQFSDYRLSYSTKLHFYPDTDQYAFFYGNKGDARYSLFSSERLVLNEGFFNLAYIAAGTRYSLYISKMKEVKRIEIFFSAKLFFEIFGNYMDAWPFLYRVRKGEEGFWNYEKNGSRLSFYATGVLMSLIENYNPNDMYADRQSLGTLRKLFETVFRNKGERTKYHYTFEELQDIRQLPKLMEKNVEEKNMYGTLYNLIDVKRAKTDEAFELLYGQLPDQMFEKKRVEAVLSLIKQGIKFPSAVCRAGFYDTECFKEAFCKMYDTAFVSQERDPKYKKFK